jgi:hypothetical protein
VPDLGSRTASSTVAATPVGNVPPRQPLSQVVTGAASRVPAV